MVVFITVFLLIIALYQIIVTVSYGAIDGWLQTMISIFRDLIWIIFVLATIFGNLKKVKPYLKERKRVYILFGVLIGFALGISFFKWTSMENMMIWIKYWFYFLFVFLSATRLGFIMNKEQISKLIRNIMRLLIWILGIGFLWQIAKFLIPDFFYWMWYWKFDDFYFGINPPIYYLTTFEWTTRWQWLFAGPNNYGYFLVAFLPLILFSLKNRKWEEKSWILSWKKIFWIICFLWFLAVLLTLSRSALVWIFFVWVLFYWWYFMKNKKLFYILLILGIAGVIGISVLKPESTIWHITQKLSWLEFVIEKPSGYGLGTSWPWVHHEWNILPENYYVQIMIDIWVLGFGIFVAFMSSIFVKFKKIFAKFKEGKDEFWKLVFGIWKSLFIWFIALLVIWIFLHVFEDSMVNYLFFVIFGIFSWFLLKENLNR